MEPTPAFIEQLKSLDAKRIDPWIFLTEEPAVLEAWSSTLGKQYPERELYPFARWTASDDLACLEKLSGEPATRISIIHAYASPGWELRDTFEDLEQWYQFAMTTADQFHSDDT